MNDNTDFDMTKFVTQYEGPKLSLLFTGLGADAAQIVAIAGASRVVYDIQIPYAREAVEAITGPLDAPSVSKEQVLALHARTCPQGVRKVTVTGAITSTRYRRGENHAYIAIDSTDGGPVRTWHMSLRKMDEKYHERPLVVNSARRCDDAMICEVAFNLLMGQHPDWTEGSLVEV